MNIPPLAPGPSLKVFIVENHEDTLRLIRRYLERKGYEVETASSMAEALKSVPQSGCDLLLSDIGLPDGTGWELLEQLQAPGPLYAVAMSGYGSVEDRLRSQKAGFKHHLLKPCLKDLAAILENRKRELILSREA